LMVMTAACVAAQYSSEADKSNVRFFIPDADRQ